ncbi:amidohydrolase family protein [Streptomyces sp. DSM 41524]|uniref:Amidohydrolase family protein n=1 Tax=Streptomyces asiaticus subsp. ignotus TaxID=3098222 RepID=A0ABU7QAC1_9ACTN|nr:amidohydrolase family protein [Streptomyces sp. DSM 41524]
MDDAVGDLEGDVLIVDDQIAEVGPHLKARTDTVVDVQGKFLLPGFIDAHIHLWQAPVRGIASGCWGREYFGIVHPLSGRLRPEDLHAATLGGAVELLTRGVTTVFDFCHSGNTVDHAQAALAALSESGIRALYGYTFRNRPEAGAGQSLDQHIDVLSRIHEQYAGHSRVGLAVSLNNMEHVAPDEHAREVAAARSLGVRASLHSNLEKQITQSWKQGLLGPDLLWVHCGPATDDELDLLADHGGVIVCTPEVEAAQMGVTPLIGRALRRSLPIVMGTDVPAASNGDILAQLRMAHAIDRLVCAQELRSEGRPVQRTDQHPSVDAHRLLRMATIDAAHALGLGTQTGSITPGKLADLLVVSAGPFGLGAASPADHVLFQTAVGDIESVYVGGRRVVDRSKVSSVDLSQVRHGLEAARDWILGRSPGANWPALEEEVRRQYEAGQGLRTP